jgi:cell division cycle 14
MLHAGLSPDDAYGPFSRFGALFKPYRDASSHPSTYDLSIVTWLKGLHRAVGLRWYACGTFDGAAYASLEASDMSWVIPGKLLAFAAPYDAALIPCGGASPGALVPVLRDLGITHIVRLCERTYDEEAFISAGFTYTHLHCPEDALPPEIVAYFHRIVVSGEVVAVHCKSGLRRTGLVVASHLIRNCGFAAGEAIAWIRMCRTGSIVGTGQSLLVKYDHAGNLKEKLRIHESQRTVRRTMTRTGEAHAGRHATVPTVQLGVHGSKIESSRRTDDFTDRRAFQKKWRGH